MNRRDLGKTLIGVLGGLGLGKLGLAQEPKEKKLCFISTLEFYPTTQYKVRWIFDTEQEAINFVQNLIPELVSAHVEKGEGYYHSWKSGYRHAVRFVSVDTARVLHTVYKLVDKRTGADILLHPDGIHFWSVDFAWLYISNIRVNGQPVHLANNLSRLPSILSMPFRRGNPAITYTDKEGFTRQVSDDKLVETQG